MIKEENLHDHENVDLSHPQLLHSQVVHTIKKNEAMSYRDSQFDL